MGADHRFSLAVGFRFTAGDITEFFGAERDAVTRPERRYSPTTGKRLPDEVVVDSPERTVLVLDGKEYDGEDVELFSMALAERLRCSVDCSDSCGDVEYVVFGVPVKPFDDGDEEFDHITLTGSGVPVSGVSSAAYRRRLKALKTKLSRAGLKPGKPGVFISYSVE